MLPWAWALNRAFSVVATPLANLIARELECGVLSSATATALYGASFTFWNQSTRVEVYSLHVLLSALVLLFALRYRRTGVTRELVLAALAGSLGVAHHLTIVLLCPALLCLCGPRLWQDPGRARRLLSVGAALLALSFAAAMMAGGGLLAFIGWVLAFGLLSPLVTLGFTAHATRR